MAAREGALQLNWFDFTDEQVPYANTERTAIDIAQIVQPERGVEGERLSDMDEKLPCLRGVPIEAHRLEPLDRLLD